MSVNLRRKENKGRWNKKTKKMISPPTTSLYLDIYQNGKHTYQFLNHLKLSKGSTPQITKKNKETLELAQKIALKKAYELSASDYSMVTESGKKTIVADWMQSYIDKYKKKDVRNMQGVLNRFKAFLLQEGKTGLTFGRIDDIIISEFQDDLKLTSKGEGASSYFARFKKMMKHAYRAKLMDRNPAADVPTIQGRARRKDTLTKEEIQLLANTPTDSEEVKKAFLFCCVTGLRWIDVKNLTWSAINGKEMIVRQSKTDREVHVNLNDTAVRLLGTRGKGDKLVFDLPTANGANKTIKALVKRAGIPKQITWHNARHSAGTLLIYYGADVTTVSSLLGHSTLKHTSRYIKAANELKERATDKLNIEL